MKLINEKKSRFARTARPQRAKMALKLSSCSGGTTSLDRRSTTPHVLSLICKYSHVTYVSRHKHAAFFFFRIKASGFFMAQKITPYSTRFSNYAVLSKNRNRKAELNRVCLFCVLFKCNVKSKKINNARHIFCSSL